jgi:hypothetical protein
LESFTLTVATKLVDTCASSGFSPSPQTCLSCTSTQPQHPARAEKKKKKKRSTSAKSPRTATAQQRQLLFDSTIIIIFARGERVLVAWPVYQQQQHQQQEQIAAGEMMEMMSDDSQHVNMSDISSNWHGLEIYPLDVSTEDDLLLSINTSSSNRPPSPIESLLGKSAISSYFSPHLFLW